MTSDDRDDADDELMRSMRPVWLAMRDEAPSDRGLAELLAAARTQAETMKPAEPSWWRRALVFAVRPPVLAAATVLVLVGGAVVIGRHRSELDAFAVDQRAGEPPTVTERWRGAQPDADALAARQAQQPLDFGKDGTRPTPEPTHTIVTDAVRPPARAPVPRVPPQPEPERDAKPDETVSVEQPADPGAKLHEGQAEPPPKDKTSSDDAPGPSGGLLIAGEDSEQEAGKPEPIPARTSSRRPVPGRTPSGVVDQLVKQAEVAAVRKDCPAVRAMAQRIKKLDSSTYKTRVTSQPAIATCLH